MKRAFSVLLCVLSAFTCLFSHAEEYYQYRIHDQYYGPFAPVFFGDNNVLYRAWGDRDGSLNLDWHLLWYRDGSLFRDFAYSADQRFSQAVFLPREEKRGDGGEKVPMSAPTVLIPYDVLPAGEPHGLRLR